MSFQTPYRGCAQQALLVLQRSILLDGPFSEQTFIFLCTREWAKSDLDAPPPPPAVSVQMMDLPYWVFLFFSYACTLETESFATMGNSQHLICICA